MMRATAILAADSLLVLAFDVLATRCPADARPEVSLRLVSDAARTVGQGGMIGGQHADLHLLRPGADRSVVEFVDRQKTGKLFELAASGAARLCDASEPEITALARYGSHLGIAYQVADDILDATQTSEATGKDAGKDVGKTTFVQLCGVEGARAALDGLAREAERALSGFGPRADVLRQIAASVRERAR